MQKQVVTALKYCGIATKREMKVSQPSSPYFFICPIGTVIAIRKE